MKSIPIPARDPRFYCEVGDGPARWYAAINLNDSLGNTEVQHLAWNGKEHIWIRLREFGNELKQGAYLEGPIRRPLADPPWEEIAECLWMQGDDEGDLHDLWANPTPGARVAVTDDREQAIAWLKALGNSQAAVDGSGQLDALIEKARQTPMTDEMREAQRQGILANGANRGERQCVPVSRSKSEDKRLATLGVEFEPSGLMTPEQLAAYEASFPKEFAAMVTRIYSAKDGETVKELRESLKPEQPAADGGRVVEASEFDGAVEVYHQAKRRTDAERNHLAVHPAHLMAAVEMAWSLQQQLAAESAALADALREVERLREDLSSTQNNFAKVVRAVKKARDYKYWPDHRGPFSDYVVTQIAALKSRAEAAERLVADHAARLHRALLMIESLPHYTRVEWASDGKCFMGERCNSCGFTGEHRPDCKLLEFIDTEKVKVVQ